MRYILKLINFQGFSLLFHRYLKNDDLTISSREFVLNMEQKIKDKDFHGDVLGLLRAGIDYDTNKAWDIIKEVIIDKL